ncbi:MAG: DNA primase [Gemmatimonadota bacterium]
MVSDAIVEEVRSRAELVDVCSEFMPLKRVGKTFRGPCPLHGGDDPNFSIDPSREIFKCFVCGEGGDVYSFVMKHLGHDFPSAVRWVADRVGVHVPDREERGDDPHAHLREAVAFAEEWFRDRLLDDGVGDPARDYLADRGVDPDAARRYGLGYAPDAWRELRDAARDRGIEDDTLLEAGLLATSERAREPYDRFRDRLIFSIQDLRDRPVGFGGRDLSGDEEVPKYINSPDSPIFHKGDTLYGLNWARHAMRRQEHGLVVEGYMDALTLHLHEVETAVAPLGTALTDRQAETLSRYADVVFLLYDSDRPGLRATFRSADTLLAAGVLPRIVTLPDGQDPDSLVRERGIDALRSLVDDAVDVLERKFQELEVRGYLDSVEGRRRSVDALLGTLRAVADPTLQDLYVGRAAERLGVREETLRTEVERERRRARRRRGWRTGRAGRGRSGPGAPRSDPLVGRGAGEGRAERNLLLLFVRDPALVERARESGLAAEMFGTERYAELYRRLVEACRDGTHGEWDRVFDDERTSMVEDLLEDATELTHPELIFEHSLGRLLSRPKRRRKEEIAEELDRDDLDDAQKQELLREYQRITRELREAGDRQGWERRFLT